LAKPRIEPSPSTPSAPDAEQIVELLPPPEAGFSGTALLFAVAQAALIQELKARGYTEVGRVRG
jgi:hypothetical protein